MRIHLQSHANPTDFPLTPELWQTAAARAPGISGGHQVTFGDTEEAFDAAAPSMEILIAQKAALAPRLPLTTPSLKLIYVTSAGLESLAPFDWLPPNVILLNNRGTHAAKAGEYGLMALLMLASRIPAMAAAQREQRWQPLHSPILAGRHVVIVGLGALGGSVAKHAKQFGMRVTGIRTSAAPHPDCDQVLPIDALDAVLPAAEFLFLAAPSTPRTENLLSRDRIAMLPEGANVANIGRGALIDQDALMDALDDDHLAGAVLDVFVPEPIPPGHRLWTTPNLIITPHVSADDPRTYNARSLDIFFGNLRAYQAGRPLPNRFDPAKGY